MDIYFKHKVGLVSHKLSILIRRQIIILDRFQDMLLVRIHVQLIHLFLMGLVVLDARICGFLILQNWFVKLVKAIRYLIHQLIYVYIKNTTLMLVQILQITVVEHFHTIPLLRVVQPPPHFLMVNNV
jgi:hypothetical protein